MVRLLFLAILLSSSPISAQWSIEESQQTDPVASRPTATAAALVSDDGRLAWEYMSRLNGRSRNRNRPTP